MILTTSKYKQSAVGTIKLRLAILTFCFVATGTAASGDLPKHSRYDAGRDCISARDAEKKNFSEEELEEIAECWRRKIVEEGERTDLEGAYLKNVEFNYRFDLINADLTNANLSGADLDHANLSGANLSGADLSGAKLFRATFDGGEYDTRRVKGTVSPANLTDTNLRGTNLEGADLKGVDLSGADLTEAKLEEARLGGAKVSRSTTKGVDFVDWENRGGIVLD